MSSSNENVFKVESNYLITGSAGEADLILSSDGETIVKKTITVSPETLSIPTTASVFVDGSPVGSEYTFYLGKTYDVTFDVGEGNSKALVITSSSRAVKGVFSDNASRVTITPNFCGESQLVVYSRVDRGEPLATVTAKVVPPRAVATGVKL